MAAVDFLAMWTSRYTSAANLMWVDSTQGNDGNAGTQASPKQSLQGAVNAAGAGTRIRLRPGNYSGANFSGKNGTNSNWIQVYLEPGAKINATGDGFGAVHFTNCSFVTFYGGEMVGLNSSGSPYEVGFYGDGGAHSLAVWGMTIHNMAAHAFAMQGAGRFDVCYNRMYDLARWNEFQTSAISAISMPSVGAAWSDGYHNHIVGNVIDKTWTDPSRVGGSGNLTDGNGIILDYSGGYPYRTLITRNLVVGCGGRGIHALGTDHVDIYNNTTVDNVQNLPGTWDAELSVWTSADSHCEYNVGCARAGRNRVGLLQDAAGSTWANNVFVRGTGGSEANDPSVSANGNVNKTATGPSGFFQQYQAGVANGASITNVAGFRPTVAQVATFAPPTAVRNAVGAWPDALGFLPPATGNWAYGAFEADTSGSATPPPSGGGGTGGGTTIPPTGSTTVEAESGTVGGTASIANSSLGFLGTGYIGFFGNTGDFNQVSVTVTTGGTYHFQIRYGNANPDGSTTQVRVLVNGVQAAVVSLPSTSSSWSDTTRFAFSAAVDLVLASGANTIRIEHTGAEFTYADLDQYSFAAATSGGTGGGGGGTAQAPVAAFAFSPTTPTVNQSVSFVDQSTNTPTSWTWNFGDGATSTAQSPTHSYATAGNFTVTHTATNAQGSNTVSKQVTVVAVSGVAGSFQHQVAGNPLANSTAYHVKVEVRDGQGLTASDTEDFATSWTAPTSPSFTVNP